MIKRRGETGPDAPGPGETPQGQEGVPRRVRVGLRRAVVGGITDPQLAELVCCFFEEAGGTRAVAKLLYREFKAAKPGTLTRQRILDMILRGMKFANEKNPGRNDLGVLTDDDLTRELESVVSRLSADGPR